MLQITVALLGKTVTELENGHLCLPEQGQQLFEMLVFEGYYYCTPLATITDSMLRELAEQWGVSEGFIEMVLTVLEASLSAAASVTP